MRYRLCTLFAIILIFFTPNLTGAQFNFYQLEYIEVPEPDTLTALVDIIIEPVTYVPSWYKGRAEPTAGNQVRALSVLHDNKAGNGNDFIYNWSLDGELISSQESSVQFTAPNANEMTISVRVVDKTNQKMIAQKTEYVPITMPKISFYEINPLRGSAKNAIPSNYNLIGDEAIIRAEPYFIGDIKNTNRLNPRWLVNNEQVESSDPQTLIVRRSEETDGQQVISFLLENQANLLERAIQKFNLSFGL